MKIHHIGVVVTDVDEALAALGLNRLNITETVFDPNQKNKLHFIHLPENNLWLELVEPVAENASTAKFAKKLANLDKIWPILANFGQLRQKMGQSWPKSVQIRPAIGQS